MAGLRSEADAVRFEIDPEVEAIVANLARRAEEGGTGLEIQGTRLDLERIMAIWSERGTSQRASGVHSCTGRRVRERLRGLT
ncbi:MAG: hypothetical protein U1F35_02865 [Steroidobacteraceae bacterium]